MSSIAIITARGGSKRIPKKNIKIFCGKPIIAYSIEAALKSGCFDTVMVSTDSDEIAEIAKKYGAEVPFLRSAETSNDYATTADVLSEVLKNYIQKGKQYDWVCCLYPTAPFITAEKLKSAMECIRKSDATSLMPVVQYSYPPQRALIIEDNVLKYQYPSYEKCRSQDLKPIYHDCGQFYICKADLPLEKGTLIGDKAIPFILSEKEVQDVDTLTDWALAEVKYRTFIIGDETECQD